MLDNEVGKKLPNILTGLRLLAVPVFVVMLIDPTPTRNLLATGLFMVASFTDWLDGYLARAYKAESILGKMLDPLADKLLVMSALVMLCSSTGGTRVPAWMVVVLLSREMVVTGLRTIASVQGIVVPAGRWAKHKTAWTMLAIVFLLVHHPYDIFGILVNFHLAGMVFLWIALFYAVTTGVGYAVALKKLFLD